jgi:hypothetical protein
MSNLENKKTGNFLIRINFINKIMMNNFLMQKGSTDCDEFRTKEAELLTGGTRANLTKIFGLENEKKSANHY